MKEISYDINNEPLVISKSIIDLCLKEENPADLISLYTFYYYTAKWQKTNQIRATAGYCMQGLKFGESRFTKANKKLRELGLIKSFKGKGTIDSNWYIQINFIWTKRKVDSLITESNTLKNEGVRTPLKTKSLENQVLGKQGTNALNVNNINALSVDRVNALNGDSLADGRDCVSAEREISYVEENFKEIFKAPRDLPKNSKVSMPRIDMGDDANVLDKRVLVKKQKAELSSDEVGIRDFYIEVFGLAGQIQINQKGFIDNIPKALKIFTDIYGVDGVAKFKEAIKIMATDGFWSKTFSERPYLLIPSKFFSDNFINTNLLTYLMKYAPNKTNDGVGQPSGHQTISPEEFNAEIERLSNSQYT